MDSFHIVLKNDKVKWYNRLGLLITFLAVVFHIYVLLTAGNSLSVILTAIGLLTAITGLVLNFHSFRTNKDPFLSFAILFISFAVIWSMISFFGLAAAMFVLALFDFFARKKQTVLISSQHIILPTIISKTISWESLNNIILKDRILTLDFKNDHLIQGEIAAESYEVPEETFNASCRQWLLKS